MPLDEQGSKWSCEPCIRGHRSSKCEHYDRLMIKVPKAGRPLAKCPHPKGTCNCKKTYAFMIRIPKGSKCYCRPVYEIAAGTGIITPGPSASPSVHPIPALDGPIPPHLTNPTPARPVSRAQKAAKRPNKVVNSSLNRALDTITELNPQFSGQRPIDTSLYAVQAPVPVPAYLQNNVNNDFHQHASSLTSNNMINSSHETFTFHTGAQTASCCTGNSQPAIQQQVAQARLSLGSCCSSFKPAIKVEPDTNTFYNTGDGSYPSAWNPSSLNGYSIPQAEYPHDFRPVNNDGFSQWETSHEAHQDNASYYQENVPYTNGTHVPDHNQHLSHRVANETGFPQSFDDASNTMHQQSTTDKGDLEHECMCGDNCECLGCSSHPYNTTTRQHVEEMGLLVTYDPDPEYSDGTQDPISQDHLDGRPNGHQTFSQDALNGDYHSPTGYISGQQLMVPSAYYTLEYPVGLPSACSDITGSCLCGNDCSCVGCLTHSGHNGVPLDPAPGENNSMSPTQDVTAEENTSGETIRSPHPSVSD